MGSRWIIKMLKSAGKNLINNLLQSQIPIPSVQNYQNALQSTTVIILSQYIHLSPKIILIVILFL